MGIPRQTCTKNELFFKGEGAQDFRKGKLRCHLSKTFYIFDLHVFVHKLSAIKVSCCRFADFLNERMNEFE